MTLSELVGEIDSNRQQGNLSIGDPSFRARLFPHPRRIGHRPGIKAASLTSVHNARAIPQGDAPAALRNSVNQAGTGRLFERGSQRPILFTAGPANRSDPTQMILRLIAVACSICHRP